MPENVNTVLARAVSKLGAPRTQLSKEVAAHKVNTFSFFTYCGKYGE